MENPSWQMFSGGVVDVGLSIAQLLGFLLLLYLLWRSQLRRHPRYLLPMLLGWLLVTLGALLLVEHWPLGTEFLLGGALLQCLPYALWTWQRRPLTLLRSLKLAWLTSTALTVIGVALHLPGRQHLAAGSQALFWAMLLYGLYDLHLRRPAMNNEQ